MDNNKSDSKIKNVALVSFIKSYNYGASLQSFALWYAIVNLLDVQCDCKYIDYNKSYKRDFFIWLFRKLISRIKGEDDNPSYTFVELFNNFFSMKKSEYLYKKEVEEKFNDFWNLIAYTPKYSKNELRNISAEYDLFIVGSDQVWNSGKVNLDTTYLI